MSETAPGEFQRGIFNALDAKLRTSAWQSGAAEAHGLLTGLACRGVTGAELGGCLHLLRLGENAAPDAEKLLLTGLFELVVRDLTSQQPVFNPLLADDDSPAAARAAELADWCSGFMQGFCHDGDHAAQTGSAEVREALRDVVEISGLQLGAGDSAENDRSLTEIEEYLRVAIQLIFDERTGDAQAAVPGGQGAAEIH